MVDDVENHTIKLLQEMRAENRAFREEVNERFDEVNTRIDGVTYIMTMLAANMGGHDERIEKLEEAVKGLNRKG